VTCLYCASLSLRLWTYHCRRREVERIERETKEQQKVMMNLAFALAIRIKRRLCLLLPVQPLGSLEVGRVSLASCASVPRASCAHAVCLHSCAPEN
jgi:hypothetical protein